MEMGPRRVRRGLDVKPASQTEPGLADFPGAASFSNVDFEIPAEAGHYDLGSILGAVGEFQITVTQVG
jgi:hypothetical protein